MKCLRFCFAALLLASLVHLPSLASGTYRGGPPRAPSSVDREAYDQGKRIFSGATALGAFEASLEKQLLELEALQEKLPGPVQKSKDLPALAGKLSPEQLEQLKYFLRIRYKVRTES